MKNESLKKTNKSSLKPTKKFALKKSVKTKVKAKSKVETKLTEKSKKEVKTVSKTKVKAKTEDKTKKVNFKGLKKINLNPSKLQKGAMVTIGILTFLTFFISNLQIFFWLKSDWLVSTVLPAVVTELTNQERGQIAEKPLARSEILDQAAKLKAEDMAKNSYFAHYSPEGVSPWHWFQEAGYTYAYAGENLAVHFNDSKMVVDAWMNSPTHKANIINDKYTEIGIGTAKGVYDGYDTVFVVQLFGTPAVSVSNNSSNSLPLVVLKTENKPQLPQLNSPEVIEKTEVLGVSNSESKSEEIRKEKPELIAEKDKQPTLLGVENSKVENSYNNSYSNKDLTKPIKTQGSGSLLSGRGEGGELRSEIIQNQNEAEVLAETEKKELNEIKDVNHLATTEQDYLALDNIPTDIKNPVFLETMSTKSGLEPATQAETEGSFSVSQKESAGNKNSFLGFLVNPRQILAFIYPILGVLTVLALLFSVGLGFKKRNFTEIGFGMALLLVMGGLFYLQFVLTGKVLIV